MIGRIAIRTSGSTQIFKVTSHYQDTRRKFAIGLDHLVTLTPLTSGGVSHHADVAFNPWYENQAGTIDGNGNWRVWDMNNRKPLNRNIKHTAGGRVTVGDEERGDGWGRFAWGGDLNTVMACDRTTPALFDIRVISPDTDLLQPRLIWNRRILHPQALPCPSIGIVTGSSTCKGAYNRVDTTHLSSRLQILHGQTFDNRDVLC